MAVDGLSFDHECDVAELRLIQDVKEIPLIGGTEHGVESLCIQSLAKVELADSCILHLVLLLRSAASLRGWVDSATLAIRQLWVRLKNVTHVLITLAHSSGSSPNVGVVQKHVVDGLGGIHLLLTWLPFLLIGLALFAIAVFVESRGTYPAASQTLLFLFHHLALMRLDVKQIRILLLLLGWLQELDGILV